MDNINNIISINILGLCAEALRVRYQAVVRVRVPATGCSFTADDLQSKDDLYLIKH